MPSNKSFYEGSVLINNIVDNLDLSGWINRSLSKSASKGHNFIRINSTHTFTKGDIVIDALTNRFIGRVKEQGGPTIVTFEKPPRLPDKLNELAPLLSSALVTI